MKIAVGDSVKCTLDGSWTDGKVGVVQRLNVTSTDGVTGHQILVRGVGVTVVPEECLTRIPS